MLRNECNPKLNKLGKLDELDNINASITSVQSSLTEIKGTVDTLNSRLSVVNNQVVALKTEVCSVVTRVSHLTSEVVDFTARVQLVEDGLHEAYPNISAVDGTGDISITACIRELNNGERRKKKLIIFGVSESSGGDPNDRLAHEKLVVHNLLHILRPETVLGTPTCERIGKFEHNLSRPRPIRVVLSDAKSVISMSQIFLKLWHTKKLPETVMDLKLTSDKTVAYREEYTQIKQQLVARQQAGEKDLRIISTKPCSLAIVHSSVDLTAPTSHHSMTSTSVPSPERTSASAASPVVVVDPGDHPK